MFILLVEDDEFKSNAIQSEILELGLKADFQVETTVHGAVQKLNEQDFDLILLDMSLPSYQLIQGKGSPIPMPSGGMEVLMELDYLGRQDEVIILTQYYEIEIDEILYSHKDAQEKINQEYNVNLLRIILFKREDKDWKKILSEEIEGLI